MKDGPHNKKVIHSSNQLLYMLAIKWAIDDMAISYSQQLAILLPCSRALKSWTKEYSSLNVKIPGSQGSGSQEQPWNMCIGDWRTSYVCVCTLFQMCYCSRYSLLYILFF